MLKQPALLFALLLPLTCAPAPAADSTLFQLVPPDSGVIIGLNLDEIRASSFGQSIFSQAQANMGPEMKKFIETTGFDPLRDIDRILIAAPARNQKSRGLFLLRGSFDRTRFAELAVQPGTTASAYRGVQVLTMKKQGAEPMSVACFDASLVVGGDPESVRAAILRRDQGAAPNAALAAKVNELGATNDIWMVSRVSPAELTGEVAAGKIGGNPQMEMLKSIEQVSGGLKFGSDLMLTADVTTRTPAEAQNIAATLRLFIGLAASGNRNAKDAAAILQKLALRAEGNSVKLSFSMPEAEIRKSFEAAMQQALARGARPAGGAAVRVATPKPAPTGITIYSSPKDMGVVTLPPPKQ